MRKRRRAWSDETAMASEGLCSEEGRLRPPRPKYSCVESWQEGKEEPMSATEATWAHTQSELTSQPVKEKQGNEEDHRHPGFSGSSLGIGIDPLEGRRILRRMPKEAILQVQTPTNSSNGARKAAAVLATISTFAVAVAATAAAALGLVVP